VTSLTVPPAAVHKFLFASAPARVLCLKNLSSPASDVAPSQSISMIVAAAASVKVAGAAKPAFAYPAALHKTVTATVVVELFVDVLSSPVVELDESGFEVVDELVSFDGAVGEVVVLVELVLEELLLVELLVLLVALLEPPVVPLLVALEAAVALALADAEALADADAVAALLATVPFPPPTVPFPPPEAVLFAERNRKNATSSSS